MTENILIPGDGMADRETCETCGTGWGPADLAPRGKDLHLLVLLYGKGSMKETLRYLYEGEPLGQIARHRAVCGADARVLENLTKGRLVHAAPTWVRRTERAAKRLLAAPGGVDQPIREHLARLVLDCMAAQA